MMCGPASIMRHDGTMLCIHNGTVSGSLNCMASVQGLCWWSGVGQAAHLSIHESVCIKLKPDGLNEWHK